MAQISDEEKLKIASSFILDSPPGEINDVFNDVRTLLDDDALLQRGIGEAFEEHNTEQLVAVDVPGAEHKVIISKYNQIDPAHYYDPRSSQVFSFDHIRQVASDPEPKDRGSSEGHRAALDDAAAQYVAEHYPDGVSSVFDDGENNLIIAISDTKYSPSNYWNGRWRSIWTASVGSNAIIGSFKVNVHYYEEGNVQLASSKEVSCTIAAATPDPNGFAKFVFKAIEKAENEFQNELNVNFTQLAGTTFKALRRTLPVTRNKIEWQSIANCELVRFI
ncbi:f-actin-capping protein subunit alpha-like protein [Blyttiomyces helicus]|uniref:F-actin-capping protein subunit alpha n=1 Tax=Blyttiomyces helicus TaxID=388810 RepID=A0A4P9WH26_9FUNG|nr:f-actin-capping protein subunit alpha-like protein [Blyttiomyces helicus]|eukprot:RKO91143.1 f-actin-capping protein subunit alpha-like protein [Blyttiomyces helicus]